MTKKVNVFRVILFCFIVICLQSCFKDKFDFSNLDKSISLSPNIGVPVAYGSLSLNDITKKNNKYVGDSIDPAGDKIIELVYDSVFQTFKASQFLQSPQIGSLSKTFALGNVKVADQQSDASIIFKQLLSDNFSTATQNYYSGIAGTTTNATGPYSQTQSVSYSINKFGNIAWVYALTGKITISITNNYAVPIQFKMLLQTDLSLLGKGTATIATFDFYNNGNFWIAPGDTASRSFYVVSQYISNSISYKFANLSLDAQNGADINLNNDKLLVTCQLGNLSASGGKVSSAQAINIDSTILFAINTYNNKKITQMDVYSGVLDYDITSHVAGLSITAKMPYVTKKGIPLSTTQSTVVGTTSKQINLAGYSMDLTQKGKDSIYPNNPPKCPWNALLAELTFKISNATFDATDSFTITFHNHDSLQFQYVKGYFASTDKNNNPIKDTLKIGQQTIPVNLDSMVKKYFKGTFSFAEPQINLKFINSIGMSASADLSIISKDSTGNSTSLFKTMQGATANYKTVSAPRDTGNTAFSVISTNYSNSNLVAIASSLPHSLTASGNIYVNGIAPPVTYNPNISSPTNFITKNATTSAEIQAILPLKLKLKDVVLQQDFPMSIGKSLDTSKLSKGEGIQLFLYTKHLFPLQIGLTLYFLDSTKNNLKLDSIAVDTLLSAAKPDSTGKVPNNVSSYSIHTAVIGLSNATDHMKIVHFAKSNKIRIQASMQTSNNGSKNVTFYTYYNIQFQLGVSANFTYNTNLNSLKSSNK